MDSIEKPLKGIHYQSFKSKIFLLKAVLWMIFGKVGIFNLQNYLAVLEYEKSKNSISRCWS